jgi:CheY-like chemotaxis protein
MNVQSERRQVILLLDDIEETRHLTEKMLGNNFCIMRAEGEEEAILKARSESPNLILMSLGLGLEQLIATAQRLRQNAALGEEVTIVIFCVPTIPEGAEMEVHKNIYVTRPDNFNQLRGFLHRLLLHQHSPTY